MISFEEAYQIVLGTARDFGNVTVPLEKADGRILAEDIYADRDFPPFDRATKDGIAIWFNENEPLDSYVVKGIAAAGSPQKELDSDKYCYEIMTGAILPENANTVVMYEHVEIVGGKARIKKTIAQGQNIHFKGGDEQAGNTVLERGQQITAAEIGVLASVGKKEVLVKRNPKISLFSTGDELVPVEAAPEAHQIRQSNSHTLRAALLKLGIASDIIHINDDKTAIKAGLIEAFDQSDVLLLSGGVSKGKFDYLPVIFEELKVQQHFHRVRQRPGKPFWFGEHRASNTMIFGFPGNPASTFANFHVYFKPWLNACFGQKSQEIQVSLEEPFENALDLTRFVRCKVVFQNGVLKGKIIHGNGSGDLSSLTKANGFIQLAPKQVVRSNELVPFIPTRQLL